MNPPCDWISSAMASAISPSYTTSAPCSAIFRIDSPSRGRRTVSPVSGASPSNRKASRAWSSVNSSSAPAQYEAMTSETGYPSVAYLMAGSRTSARVSRPSSSIVASQPRAVPGTVTAWGP